MQNQTWTNENGQEYLEQNERLVQLHKAIKQLPARDVDLITLYYLQEKNIKDVSIITGITEANIKVKLFRARKQLAELYLNIKVK